MTIHRLLPAALLARPDGFSGRTRHTLSLELLRNTHNFEESLHNGETHGRVNARFDFAIGFAAAAVAASAAFLGEKRRAAELFDASWKNVWVEPWGMNAEGPLQDYACFLTNFGSYLQTVMFGFTGLRVNEGSWTKYPASLPAGLEQNRN